MTSLERIGMLLCLLTRAAWLPEMPNPLTRRMVHRLQSGGAMDEFSVRAVCGISQEVVDRGNILLSRHKDVMLCVQSYMQRGYIIVTREDSCWPAELDKLRESERPLFLFLKGNRALLNNPKIAVAGSREISRHTASLARHAGQMIASEAITMVSGGAQGVDSAAHGGLLELGGKLILVPAKPENNICSEPELRAALENNSLLVLYDTLPDDPFSTERALARNHVIYALADAALVIAARNGVGGSWHGASDCLRDGYTPVYVPDDTHCEDMAGCRALQGVGAGTIDLFKSLKEQMIVENTSMQTDLFSMIKSQGE